MILRPDDSMILYNTACVFCSMGNKKDALIAIRKAWESGYRDGNWARHDPTSRSSWATRSSRSSILRRADPVRAIGVRP